MSNMKHCRCLSLVLFPVRIAYECMCRVKLRASAFRYLFSMRFTFSAPLQVAFCVCVVLISICVIRILSAWLNYVIIIILQ